MINVDLSSLESLLLYALEKALDVDDYAGAKRLNDALDRVAQQSLAGIEYTNLDLDTLNLTPSNWLSPSNYVSLSLRGKHYVHH